MSRLPVIGERLPLDPRPRRPVLYRFGPARALHLGDYLGPVRGLRALAADPEVDLTVSIAGSATEAAHVAAALVGCGLGSVSFGLDADIADPVAEHESFAADSLPGSSAVEVFDLRHPRRLMGSVPTDARGVVHLLDSPLRVAAAIRGTTTDLDPTLGYDPQLRPGIANLAVILGALTGRSPVAALFALHGSPQLKRAVIDAVEAQLRPVRERYRALATDPDTLHRLVGTASL